LYHWSGHEPCLANEGLRYRPGLNVQND
jgi:hypothetical protein